MGQREASTAALGVRVVDGPTADDNGTASPLVCRWAVSHMTEYLEEALDGPRRAQLEAHLGSCEACRADLTELQRTIRVLGELPPEPLSDDMRERLLEIYRGWHRSRG